MSVQPVLIDGEWIPSSGTSTFQAVNPATKEPLPHEYPVSGWDEVERAIDAAALAFQAVRDWPGARFARFLHAYADAIEARTEALVEAAHTETALPASPRLKDVELPRTIGQLRKAGAAAEDGSWKEPTIDTATNIRAMFESLGPVAVFGPNNFPFAFNSVAGGDFAAAVAAGCPVIAKGHSSHPRTTQIFAEAARDAAVAAETPSGFVQLIYRTSHADGARLVSHASMGATGYTGSRSAGLVLKAAADKAGKPIYLELSSINPVFILPGALDERFDEIVDEFATSCLMGTGQFCTNPGVVFLEEGDAAGRFLDAVRLKFEAAPAGTMLGEGVQTGFLDGVGQLRDAGAELVTGGDRVDEDRYACLNTLLRVDGDAFIQNSEALQAEAFGNESLFVVVRDSEQMATAAAHLEGNLTGCIYSDPGGADDAVYDRVAPVLKQRVGRLLNDKMPTGVAVSPAMNHGGPYPATGHPGFTAVGIPASLKRFAKLQCYDNVRAHRLPTELKDENSTGAMWRQIDGKWTQANVG